MRSRTALIAGACACGTISGVDARDGMAGVNGNALVIIRFGTPCPQDSGHEVGHAAYSGRLARAVADSFIEQRRRRLKDVRCGLLRRGIGNLVAAGHLVEQRGLLIGHAVERQADVVAEQALLVAPDAACLDGD